MDNVISGTSSSQSGNDNISSSQKHASINMPSSQSDGPFSSNIIDIVSSWNESYDKTNDIFLKCPKLKSKSIFVDNKETTTANNTFWISDSLENFQKLMSVLSVGSEADKIILGLDQQTVSPDPSYVKYSSLQEPFAQIVACKIILDKPDIATNFSRTSMIGLINDFSHQYIYPILRDIKICRRFGDKEEWYRAFYNKRFEDLCDCLPFVGNKKSGKRKLDSDNGFVIKEQVTKKTITQNIYEGFKCHYIFRNFNYMKKQTAKNAVCTFHDMVSKKVMISKKISMVEDSDLWNFHFPSSTNMPNEEDTSKRRMDRTEEEKDERRPLKKQKAKDNREKKKPKNGSKLVKIPSDRMMKERSNEITLYAQSCYGAVRDDIDDLDTSVIDIRDINKIIEKKEELTIDDIYDALTTISKRIENSSKNLKKKLAYAKLGVSTEPKVKRQQRGSTYCKDSTFLVEAAVPLAKSMDDALKYEKYLFDALEKSGCKKIPVGQKTSSRGEFYWLHDELGNYAESKIGDIVKKVAESSFVSEVRSSRQRLYWPVTSLLNDVYDDDLHTDCINNIASFMTLKNYQDILFIGISGGGYNMALLCKEIIDKKDGVKENIRITVIDRMQAKIQIARSHIVDMELENITFYALDFLDFNICNAAYDCVFCLLIGNLNKIEALKLLKIKSKIVKCKVYITQKAKKGIYEVQKELEEVERAFIPTNIELKLSKENIERMKYKKICRLRIYMLNIKFADKDFVEFALNLRNDMIKHINYKVSTIETGHKEMKKTNSNKSLFDFYNVKIDKRSNIRIWNRTFQWNKTEASMQNHLALIEEKLRKSGRDDSTERNTLMLIWWISFLHIPGINYCTDKLNTMEIFDEENIEKSYSTLFNKFNVNKADVENYCGTWACSYDQPNGRTSPFCGANKESDDENEKSYKYLQSSLKSYGLKFSFARFQTESDKPSKEFKINDCYNSYNEIAVLYVPVVHFIAESEEKAVALAMIFAKIEKDALLKVYAVLMEPQSDEDDGMNFYGDCLKKIVEDDITIEGGSSRVTWIMSDIWGSSQIKIPQSSFKKKYKAEVIVKWIVNIHNCLCKDSQYVDLLSNSNTNSKENEELWNKFRNTIVNIDENNDEMDMDHAFESFERNNYDNEEENNDENKNGNSSCSAVNLPTNTKTVIDFEEENNDENKNGNSSCSAVNLPTNTKTVIDLEKENNDENNIDQNPLNALIFLPNEIVRLYKNTKLCCSNNKKLNDTSNISICVADALRVAGYTHHQRGWLEMDSVDYHINKKFQLSFSKQKERNNICVFPSMFFRALTEQDSITKQNTTQQLEMNYENVKKFHKNEKFKNIFEKKYVYIPIVLENHFILICVVGLNCFTAKNKSATKIDILIMDSMKTNIAIHNPIISVVKSYLIADWTRLCDSYKTRRVNHSVDVSVDVSTKITENDISQHLCTLLPQQQNTFDCGIFAIEYFNLATEWFLKSNHENQTTEIEAFLQYQFDPIDTLELRRVIINDYLSEYYKLQKVMNWNRGIPNFGSTCFISVMMQSLLNIKSFNAHFITKPSEDEHDIANILNNFIRNMFKIENQKTSLKKTIDTFHLKCLEFANSKQSQYDVFIKIMDDTLNKFEYEDPLRWLNLLLEMLLHNTSIEKTKDYIKKTFYLDCTTEKECCVNEDHRIINHDPNKFGPTIIYLDLSEKKTLQAHLNDYYNKPKELSACEYCSGKFKHREYFSHLSSILIIVFQRSEWKEKPNAIASSYVDETNKNNSDEKANEISDAMLYPMHSLDLSSAVNQTNKINSGDSNFYDLDSVSHFDKHRHHYVTTIPVDKEYSRWYTWDDLNTQPIISRKEHEDMNTSYVLFYRKNEGYLISSQLEKHRIAVQYPALPWYVSASSLSSNKSAKVEEADKSLICLKHLQQQVCSTYSLAVYILHLFHQKYIANGAKLDSACSVYLQVESWISNDSEYDLKEYYDVIDIDSLKNKVSSVSPGSMVWFANSGSKFMTCQQHRTPNIKYSNLDILVEDDDTIKFIYTDILTRDIEEGYHALALALCGSKEYLKWRTITGTRDV